MIRFCHSYRGTISIFLILILLPTFILAGVIIDGSRIYASRNIVSGAGDLAMNAALADYDSTLKDMYSLFAMSGTKMSDDKIEQYFKENINSVNLSYGSYDSLPVYLMLKDGLKIDRVEGTESYQTQVMLQQVLEYSKYRIPILLISSGLLDGLNSFEGMDKKVDAISSQLTFEEELTDLQKLIEDLKEKLDEHDKIYEYFVKIYPSVMPNVKRNYKLIAMLDIACKVLAGDVGVESGACKDLMAKYVELGSDLTQDYAGDNYYNNAQKALGNFENLYKMLRIKNAIQDPNEVYNGLEEGTDEWKEAESLLENYAEKVEVYTACEQALFTFPDELMEKSKELLVKAHAQSKAGIECTEEIIKLSEKIKDKNSDGSSLKNAHKDFGEKINRLDDEEMKAPMQKEYEDYDRLLDNDKVDILIQRAKNNQTFYEETKSSIEGITFCNVQLYISYENMTFLDKASGYSTGVTTNAAMESGGNRFYGDEFQGGDFSTSTELTDLSKEEFYQFVQEKCDTSQVSESEKQQRIDETNANLSKGDESKKLIEESSVSKDAIDLSDVPTSWIEEEGSTESDVDIDVDGKADDKESRKKASKAAKKSIGEVTEQTSGLSTFSDSIVDGAVTGAAMNIVESLLVTGYEAEMFSYYTVDKDENGNTQTKSSLTGYEFSQDNNVMYKSEMEYMLFGKDVPADNVKNAKATLYAIRFGLNAIGAFSSSSLRTEADEAALAITGGLGSFALPLARSIVILGTTCLETYKDMQELLNGKAVTVLKFNGTWHITGHSGEDGSFKLDYLQYLMLFLAIRNLGESGMTQSLARTADCIELNIRKNGSSTMKNKQTMITLDAKVGVGTSFMKNAVMQINSEGGSAREINDNDFDIRYHGILGY